MIPKSGDRFSRAFIVDVANRQARAPQQRRQIDAGVSRPRAGETRHHAGATRNRTELAATWRAVAQRRPRPTTDRSGSCLRTAEAVLCKGFTPPARALENIAFADFANCLLHRAAAGRPSGTKFFSRRNGMRPRRPIGRIDLPCRERADRPLPLCLRAGAC
jgi:hypothetical protein